MLLMAGESHYRRSGWKLAAGRYGLEVSRVLRSAFRFLLVERNWKLLYETPCAEKGLRLFHTDREGITGDEKT